MIVNTCRKLPRTVASVLTLAITSVLALPLLALPASAAGHSGDRLQTVSPKPVPRTAHPLDPVPLPTPGTLSTQGATALATTCLNPTIDQKVLVVGIDGNEPALPAITRGMDYLGVPYTVYLAANTPGGLTDNLLASDCHAFYSGLITTSGDLGYQWPDGHWGSALSDAEWQTFWQYASLFKVRQVSWYTRPTPLYGFQSYSGGGLGTNTPLPLTLTTGGQNVWTYINAKNAIPLQYAWTYPAQPLDDTTVGLLTDPSGNLLGAMHPNSDGRETLALTFDSNQYMLHNMVLHFGLINWVTRGLFLGERHIFASPQIDDLYIDDAVWQTTTPCGTAPDATSLPVYRSSGSDVGNLLAWQTNRQKLAQYAGFRLAFAFNGYGTTSAYYNSFSPALQDSGLTSAVQTNNAAFNFVNHTWDHQNLDNATYSFAKSEFQQNNQFAIKQPFTNFSKLNLVTPELSGLTNSAVLQAAYDVGIRYTVTNTSLAGWNNPSPNTGVPIAGSYGISTYSILGVPRRPVNLYFNVTTMDEWLAEDNCLYPSGVIGNIGGIDSALLDRVSGNVSFVGLLQYMLSGDMDPWMFHQANIRAYYGTKFLLGDLLDATFAKYQALFSLPVQSLAQDALGKQMADRAAYNAAGVTASRTSNTLTITATQAATVPVTGLNIKGSELYGGQYIAHIKLAAGQSVSYTIR